MLAVSPLSATDDAAAGFVDDGNLLDYFDFSEPFSAFDDGDVLLGLEVAPSGILAELSAGECDGGLGKDKPKLMEEKEKREEKDAGRGEEVVSTVTTVEGESRRKPSARLAATGKNWQGKRKAKVDWTPDLHGRFVQAVEQLGMDKAVPSRIRKLMGMDCLTRHNIASHLQKYRSHRKHVLARAAEEAGWTQRRQMYGGGGMRREMVSPWLAPAIGFPPPAPAATVQYFRPPLHVWGHPTVDPAPLVLIWPRHLAPRATMPPWFPQPLPTVRLGVPGNSLQPMYRPILPPASKNVSPHLPLDPYPSKESIDAAIGDVLAKPWLPLPLGLKPPSTESVVVELQRQGISIA